jgi:hypothetical protein
MAASLLDEWWCADAGAVRRPGQASLICVNE